MRKLQNLAHAGVINGTDHHGADSERHTLQINVLRRMSRLHSDEVWGEIAMARFNAAGHGGDHHHHRCTRDGALPQRHPNQLIGAAAAAAERLCVGITRRAGQDEADTSSQWNFHARLPVS